MSIKITDNVKKVRENIAGAAIRSGREPARYVLSAAAKTKEASMVRQAVGAGVDAVGENRLMSLPKKKNRGIRRCASTLYWAPAA
jgi:uncharacterized pyridoxal phosphate-containing UPF0001 family protein